jgi:hypothetical protein
VRSASRADVQETADADLAIDREVSVVPPTVVLAIGNLGGRRCTYRVNSLKQQQQQRGVVAVVSRETRIGQNVNETLIRR